MIFFPRIFSCLDVVSLCRCAQVSKAWNVLALDGSNWQRIDLFDFQRDVEVRVFLVILFGRSEMFIMVLVNQPLFGLFCFLLISGSCHRKHFSKMWGLLEKAEPERVSINCRWVYEVICTTMPQCRRFKPQFV